MAAVRSRQAELHYRLMDATPSAEVRLWYTRDRGASWREWGVHTDHNRPILFSPPAEGLYGFFLIVQDFGQSSASPPVANTPPQQWAFIDYTPPLAQWDSVEPGEAFAARRIVHLQWTAHDDHLPTRPVTLSYQSSIDQAWHVVSDGLLPNTGRYDWKVPPEVAGQVTLKLAVRDLGGHVVERLFGPVPVERWMNMGLALDSPSPTTQPAQVTGLAQGNNQPASRPAASDADRQKARELYDLASWHLVRKDYGVAAQRLREAIEADPDLLEARNDLACIYHLQRDYPKAIELFNQILESDSRYTSALWGAHESHIAQRQYNQSRQMLERILEINDKDAQAYLDLGDVLFMMGDEAGAREPWSKACTVDKTANEIIKRASERLKAYGASRRPGTADAREKR